MPHLWNSSFKPLVPEMQNFEVELYKQPFALDPLSWL